MALTKVSGDFLDAGSITQAHLHTSHGITTTHIAEGDKLFFTNARVDSRVGSLSTSDLSEGTNLYYTDARADARIAAADTGDLSEGTNLYYTQARFNTAFTAKSTSDLSEGTNLYYTDARADARITAADTDSLSEGSTNLYYTDARADARVALIVDSAPGTLNTLNELAAALGDDANFSTTVTNSIATKLPLAGGTLTGNLTVNARGFFNGGGAYPLQTSSTQRYNFQIRNTNNTVNSGYGWWLATDTDFDFALHADGAGDRFTLTRTGNATFTGTITASGYNNSNWDTAYGWGDHASGGYAADNAVMKLTGNQTISGTKTFDSGSIVISGTHGTISFMDTTSAEDNFYIHVNSNNFYVLADRDGSNTIDGGYETPHPLQLEGDTNTAYVFGSALNISNWNTAYGWGDHGAAGYLTSYTETDTLATVTGRGATTSTQSIFTGKLRARGSQTAGNYTTAALWTESYNSTPTGIAFHISGNVGKFLEMRTNGTLYWDNGTVWHSGNDGSGSGLDADLLDGQHASAFLTSLPSHTHDDRYYTEAEMQSFFNRGYINRHNASNLPVGWYTIATNTGDRALGEFQIWDTASSDHQSVLFSASHHFGTNTSNDITVLANSRYSGTNFRYIRIKEHGTYDGAALQVYVDGSSNSCHVAIVGGNAQESGWVLKDWVADGTDPGDVSSYNSMTERTIVDLDLTQNGGIITTGPIYSGGQTAQYKALTSQGGGVQEISGTGTAANPLLTLTNSSSSAFNHSLEVFTPNMTANESNILVVGKAGSTKNSGYIGYNYASAGSNNNYVTIGQWGADHLFRIYGDQITSQVTFRGQSDVRGTIFYDTNDSAYYMNFYGGGKLRGNFEFAANSTSTSYDNASIELRESNYTGNGTATPPFIGFHWGGVVASNIAIESNGRIAIKNNPGNAYEKFIASNVYASSDFQGPIYYDSNDTGFYLNPASQSRLGSLKLDGIISGAASGCAEYGRNHAYHTSELKGYGAEFMIGAQHTEININYRTCNNGASGHTPATWKWRAGTASNWSDHYMGLIQSASSMRAPIFYDSNDTSYYVNPAGLSDFYSIKTTSSVDIAPRWDTSFYVAQSQHYYGHTSTQTMYLGEANHINIRNIADIHGQARAPIYYDRNNTGYYMHPDSTSVIVGLTMAGALQTAGSHTVGSSGTSNIYMGGTSGNHFRFHTTSGSTYFDMNSGNINWRNGSSTRFIFYNTTANMTVYGTITQHSDLTIKNNIVEIPNCIDKVKSIRGIYYNRTDFNIQPTKIGVIAQEVEVEMPELVHNEAISGIKSVSYTELTAVLVNAIKEQQTIIDDLKTRLETLENN